MPTDHDASALRTDLFLRAATPNDAWALARLRRASLLELGHVEPGDAARFECEAYRELRELFESGLLAAWVLVANARVVGAACVVSYRRLPYARTSWHAELAGVFVERAYRRRGYARELCGEALGSARASGARAIFVVPSRDGRALYESLGFRPNGTLALALE